jgi:hypothetical protein
MIFITLRESESPLPRFSRISMIDQTDSRVPLFGRGYLETSRGSIEENGVCAAGAATAGAENGKP